MTATDRNELIEERDYLLESIRRLEDEHRAGALSTDEFRALSDEQTKRAATVIRRLEGGGERESDDAQSAAVPAPSTSGTPSSKRRTLIYLVLSGVFVVFSAFALIATTDVRLPGESSTGDIAADTNTLLRAAQQQAGSGDVKEALETYDDVLRRDPDNVEALAYRGWLLRLGGFPDEGLRDIERAIAINPNYPDARFFRGLTLLRDRQQPAAAVPEFEAFLANNPPAEFVPLVQQALDDARAQAAGRPPVD